MKLSHLVFALSMVTNVALLFALRSMPSREPWEPGRSGVPAASVGVGDAGRVVTPEPAQPGQHAMPEGRDQDAGAWEKLHIDDLGVFAARLRAAGFPPAMVRAMVGSAVHERFLAQREELLGDEGEAPFWKLTPHAYSDPEKAAALSKLSREREEMLRQLLGPDAEPDDLQNVYLKRQYGDLPPEKLRRLQSVLADYQDLRAQLQPPNRPATAEDRANLTALEREQRSDLARLLTPEELEQYDLRSSATANQLRFRLDSFRPSEEEYRAIFQLSRGLDERFPLSSGAEPQVMAARHATEQENQGRLEAALGPERYADYLQATNPAHATLNRIVERFDLPLTAARGVVAVQQETRKRAQTVLDDDSLTPEQQDAQVRALHADAAERLARALPPAAMEAYRQHAGGWLGQLRNTSGTTR